MASVNKVILLGHLGKDAETRTFSNGEQVCNITIATSEKWEDKQSGEMRELTEWHNVSFFGRTAEIAAQYLRCVERQGSRAPDLRPHRSDPRR